MKKWLWLLTASLVLIGVISVMELSQKYGGKSYTDTMDFESDFTYFTDRLIALELDPVSAEKSLPVTSEEIEEYRTRFGSLAEQILSIQNQYNTDIEDAASAGNKSLEEALTQERDKKIEEIRNNFSEDETVVRKIEEERKNEIERLAQEMRNEKPAFLEETQHYVYELKNSETGETYTKGELSSDPYYERKYSASNPLSTESNLYGTGSESEMESDAKFVGTIQIDRSMLAASPQGESYVHFGVIKSIMYVSGAIAIAGAVILWTHLRFNLKWFTRMELYEKWSRLTMDIRFLLALLSLFFGLMAASELFRTMANVWPADYIGYGLDLAWKLIVAIILIGVTILQIIWLYAYYRNGDLLTYEFRQSFVFRNLKNMHEAFLEKSIGFQALILLVIVFLWGAGSVLALVYPPLILVWLVASAFIGLPVVFVMMNRFGYLNLLMLKTEAIANGQLNQELPIRGRSPLARHAKQLNELKEGVRLSMSEQAKSERLKTELITNVSHDLRTPLTSIITYTDLMKTPQLTDEERISYAEILDRKSQRLKTLIEDLFEVSKMASGNMELHCTRIDLNQLLQQALAEHAEDIELSGLDFRIAHPNKPVYAQVDGQKWWRVLDNLILNAIKYALPGTRVYLSLEEMDGQAEFTIKNITRYELGENTDELFERFKRGDESRQTDGSGLGLAIAQSIVDLHGGAMKIEVDGDLFKVTVAVSSI